MFFAYLFRTDYFRKILIKLSGKVTISNISQSLLKSIKLPIPEIEEQCEIVEIMESLDKKIVRLESKYVKYQMLFRTVLHKLMNQEIDVSNLEFENA
mgnify:CR=1 FL=1